MHGSRPPWRKRRHDVSERRATGPRTTAEVIDRMPSMGTRPRCRRTRRPLAEGAGGRGDSDRPRAMRPPLVPRWSHAVVHRRPLRPPRHARGARPGAPGTRDRAGRADRRHWGPHVGTAADGGARPSARSRRQGDPGPWQRRPGAAADVAGHRRWSVRRSPVRVGRRPADTRPSAAPGAHARADHPRRGRLRAGPPVPCHPAGRRGDRARRQPSGALGRGAARRGSRRPRRRLRPHPHAVRPARRRPAGDQRRERRAPVRERGGLTGRCSRPGRS